MATVPERARWKDRFRHLLFGLLGKDPEGVVVGFWTANPGHDSLAESMLAEMRELEPRRRHFVVSTDNRSVEGADAIRLRPGGTLSLYWQLWQALRKYRVGIAPVLLDSTPMALRRAVFLYAPFKILAYNTRLERHHLRLTHAISSLLFLAGVSKDRIYLRPHWMTPWKKKAADVSAPARILDGRSLTPGIARIAVVSPYVPWPLSHGGAVRMFNLLRETSREFDIFLFAFEEEFAYPAPLLEFCAKVILVPKPRYLEPRWSTVLPPEVREYESAEMHRVLDRVREQCDIALTQVEYTQLAQYRGDVLVEHDVTFDLYGQVLRRHRSMANWLRYMRWRFFEEKAFWNFRLVTVMSEKDVGLLSERERVRVVENGVDLERFRPQPEAAGQRILFIGSFRHFPNITAYRFLTEQIWPMVMEQCPDAELICIAGPDHLLHWRNFTGEHEPPRLPRVEVMGYVDDVRPAYGWSNLVVVPTTVSAGTNVKVLEAIAMERAIVSTKSGCAGLGLTHGETVWIADDPADFAAGVAQLLYHWSFRSRMARMAREYVESRYDWSRIGYRQRAIYWELLGEPSPRQIGHSAG